MNIGEAVRCMKHGNRVTRKGWNGKGMWLAIDNNTTHTPFVYMKTVTGVTVPWLCSQTDLLAEDWDMVPTSET